MAHPMKIKHPDKSHKQTGAGHVDGPHFTAKRTDKGPKSPKELIGKSKRRM